LRPESAGLHSRACKVLVKIKNLHNEIFFAAPRCHQYSILSNNEEMKNLKDTVKVQNMDDVKVFQILSHNGGRIKDF
jgi:hypothetical protein